MSDIPDRLKSLHRTQHDALENGSERVDATEDEQRPRVLADREANLCAAFEKIREKEPDALKLRVQYVTPLTRGAAPLDSVDGVEAGKVLRRSRRPRSPRCPSPPEVSPGG